MTGYITPHLNFRRQARAALDFYAAVFGGEVSSFTYRDARMVTDPAEADDIVWGQVDAGGGIRIMAFDVPAAREFDRGVESFFVSVRGDDAEEITRWWEGLRDGATIVQDLGPAGWAPVYGMLRDRFGVTWVLDVAVPYAG